MLKGYCEDLAKAYSSRRVQDIKKLQHAEGCGRLWNGFAEGVLCAMRIKRNENRRSSAFMTQLWPYLYNSIQLEPGNKPYAHSTASPLPRQIFAPPRLPGASAARTTDVGGHVARALDGVELSTSVGYKTLQAPSSTQIWVLTWNWWSGL